MTTTVALTGATGFIGSHIVERLLAQGFRVRALTRSSNKLATTADLTWISGSLEDPTALTELVEGADCVIHCAGQVRGKNQDVFTQANVVGSLNLLAAAEKSLSCKRYLFISSLAARHPDLSWYAYSKATAEQQLVQHSTTVSVGIFRPTAVYGPRDTELHPVFAWLLRGYLPQIGPATAKLSFLHVHDFADATLQWIKSESNDSTPYELCDGLSGGYSWQSLQQLGMDLRGKPVTLIKIPFPLLRVIASASTALSTLFGKQPMLTQSKLGELTHTDWSANNATITQCIGWAPTIQLDRALRDGLF